MKVRLLFVCLGNICRSPAAEAVMQKLVEEHGLLEQIDCDSAGTSGWHDGEPADPRTRQHGKRRGYKVTSISRRVLYPQDYQRFDYILAMDESNYKNLLSLDREGQYRSKVHKMLSFGTMGVEDVPDPYYGGEAGFERVMDLLEDACQGLLRHLREAGKIG
jgi:protein-tyrosine phosphatase